VSAALRQLAPAHAVESIDVSACPRRQGLDEEAWDRVVAAILSSDLTITI